jgi:hypothetical protein
VEKFRQMAKQKKGWQHVCNKKMGNNNNDKLKLPKVGVSK